MLHTHSTKITVVCHARDFLGTSRHLTSAVYIHRLRQTYTPPDKPVAVATENAAGEGQAGGTKKAKKNKQSREGVDDDGYVHDAGCACTVM
jgi:hypothetical protein